VCCTQCICYNDLMIILYAVLLMLVLVTGWVLTVLGMPGNWLMVAATAVYVALAPGDSRASISWPVVLAMLVLAALGEAAELLASAAGVSRRGGSKRGAALALAGSIVGAVVGVFVGVPVPVIGSAIAALIFAGVGAFIGAVLGEMWAGKEFGDSCRVGTAAFWGRLFGTLAKTMIGFAMLVVAAAALLIE
jgi:uncharacterized protein